jgi:hypothetical protein
VKLIWEISIPSELNRERQIMVNNRKIWACLGPMDVPREVVVTRQQKRLQLELHYSAPCDEKLSTTEFGALRVTTGKRSGRVFFVQSDIGLDMDELGKPFKHLKNSVSDGEGSRRPQRRRVHYMHICEDVLPFVIDEVKHELMMESR